MGMGVLVWGVPGISLDGLLTSEGFPAWAKG